MNIDKKKLQKARFSVCPKLPLEEFLKRSGSDIAPITWRHWELGLRHPRDIEKVLKALNEFKIEGWEMKRIKPFTLNDLI